MLEAIGKKLAELNAAVAVSPLVAACKMHQKLHPTFNYYHYGYLLSLVPTEVGRQLRRAFYRHTLRRCGESLSLEFGSYFVSADTEVGDYFTTGAFCIVGRAKIDDYVMLASRCSVLSGLDQHGHDDDDGQPMIFQQVEDSGCVEIGRNVWVGEGAIVGADVGENSIVGVGAVVARNAKDNVVMLGNPARVVKHRGPKT